LFFGTKKHRTEPVDFKAHTNKRYFFGKNFVTNRQRVSLMGINHHVALTAGACGKNELKNGQ
jgi:hypothetical protein